MKLHDLELAFYETGLYCSISCLAQTGLACQSPIYIGMLCSRSHLALHVYIEDEYSETNTDEHKMWQILVKKGATHSKRNFCVHCTVGFTTHRSHPQSYCLATSPISGVVKFNVVEHKTHGQCTLDVCDYTVCICGSRATRVRQTWVNNRYAPTHISLCVGSSDKQCGAHSGSPKCQCGAHSGSPKCKYM